MSRLLAIMENHARLDELMAIIKHHGVNAAFVAEALVHSVEQQSSKEETPEKADFGLLLEDLQQYQARF